MMIIIPKSWHVLILLVHFFLLSIFIAQYVEQFCAIYIFKNSTASWSLIKFSLWFAITKICVCREKIFHQTPDAVWAAFRSSYLWLSGFNTAVPGTAELHGLEEWWIDWGSVTPVLLFQYLFCDYHQVLR